MRIVFLLLPLFFFVGCEEEPVYSPPSNLLPEAQYLKVLTEVHLFNALVQSADSVANEDSLRLALYMHYNVTENQFLESHTYYQSQPMQHTIRLDSVSNRLKKTLEILNESRVLSDSLTGNTRVFQ